MAKFNYISTLREPCGEPCGEAACCWLLPCFQDPGTEIIDGDFEVVAAGFANQSCLECNNLNRTYLISVAYNSDLCELTGQVPMPGCNTTDGHVLDQYFNYVLYLRINPTLVELTVATFSGISGLLTQRRYQLSPDAAKGLCDGSALQVPLIDPNSGTCIHPISLSLRYIR